MPTRDFVVLHNPANGENELVEYSDNVTHEDNLQWHLSREGKHHYGTNSNALTAAAGVSGHQDQKEEHQEDGQPVAQQYRQQQEEEEDNAFDLPHRTCEGRHYNEGNQMIYLGGHSPRPCVITEPVHLDSPGGPHYTVCMNGDRSIVVVSEQHLVENYLLLVDQSVGHDGEGANESDSLLVHGVLETAGIPNLEGECEMMYGEWNGQQQQQQQQEGELAIQQQPFRVGQQMVLAYALLWEVNTPPPADMQATVSVRVTTPCVILAVHLGDRAGPHYTVRMTNTNVLLAGLEVMTVPAHCLEPAERAHVATSRLNHREPPFTRHVRSVNGNQERYYHQHQHDDGAAGQPASNWWLIGIVAVIGVTVVLPANLRAWGYFGTRGM